MFYVKKDAEDRRAMDLFKEVLQAHNKEKEIKSKFLAETYALYELDRASLTEVLKLEDEINILEYQISGIQYAIDYATLMLNMAGDND